MFPSSGRTKTSTLSLFILICRFITWNFIKNEYKRKLLLNGVIFFFFLTCLYVGFTFNFTRLLLFNRSFYAIRSHKVSCNVLRLCRSCELRTAIFSTKLRHNFERKNFRRKFISQFRKTAVRRSVDFENWCWILNRMCLRDYRNYVQSLEFWLVSF